jgi:hypothetical protein
MTINPKFICIVSCLILLLACNKQTEIPEGTPATASSNDTKALNNLKKYDYFPHPLDFKAPSHHGEAFLQVRDDGYCQACHGQKLEGKGVEKLSCKKCHQDYPHTEQFKFCARGDSRCTSTSPITVQDKKSCKNCHDDPNQKDKIAAPTRKGQPIFHSKIFKTSTLHGMEYYKYRSIGYCQNCHTVENQKELAIPSCLSCHNFPHNSGDIKNWSTGTQHGVSFIAEWKKQTTKSQSKVSCLDCHKREVATGGSLPPRQKCMACHKIEMPHDQQFIDSMHHDTHRELAVTHMVECQICHLNPSKQKEPTLQNFDQLLPNKFTLPKTEQCIKCHIDRGVKNRELSYLTDINRLKDTKPSCQLCHGGPQLKLLPKKKIRSLGQGGRCTTCHLPNIHR